MVQTNSPILVIKLVFLTVNLNLNLKSLSHPPAKRRAWHHFIQSLFRWNFPFPPSLQGMLRGILHAKEYSKCCFLLTFKQVPTVSI